MEPINFNQRAELQTLQTQSQRCDVRVPRSRKQRRFSLHHLMQKYLEVKVFFHSSACRVRHRTYQWTFETTPAPVGQLFSDSVVNTVWIKMAGRSRLAAIHKKSFIVIFCLFTFLMMAIDHLFLYNKRTALNDWKPKRKCKQIKSKSILDSFVFFSSPVVLFCSVWFELINLGTKVCQSSPMQRPGVCGRLLILVLGPVAGSSSVGVRCGWAGARGWTAGCSPPSPWWSSEEQTAYWGTADTKCKVVLDKALREQVNTLLWGIDTGSTMTAFTCTYYSLFGGKIPHNRVNVDILNLQWYIREQQQIFTSEKLKPGKKI